jgi:hypothetical protein
MKIFSPLTVAATAMMASASTEQDTIVQDMSLDDSFLSVLEGDGVPRVGHHRRLSTTDFVLLVACHTWGRLPAFPGPDALALADYGCWCGTLTKLINGPCNGGRAVDATDKCCMTHDMDWGANAPQGCNCAKQNYGWDCDSTSIVPLRFKATCDPGQGACATYCCKADLKFANCVIAAAGTQNNAGKRHRRIISLPVLLSSILYNAIILVQLQLFLTLVTPILHLKEDANLA